MHKYNIRHTLNYKQTRSRLIVKLIIIHFKNISRMESTDHYRNIKETYKIEATLGKGSFATVKKAKNRATGERFAVKVLSKKKMSEEDKLAMQTEIEILK